MIPKANEIWQHRNGNFYQVLFLTNITNKSEKYPPTVVYENVRNKHKFSRKLCDWNRSMTFHAKDIHR